jgi:hypothetical protein
MYGKKKMKKGGKLKPVDSKKNPGLAKLPTDVRNKMGFMEMGGKMSKSDKEFMYGGAFKKVAEKKNEMMNRFSGAIEAKFGKKKPLRKKKMMKGGKMNYPGGGRIQHD